MAELSSLPSPTQMIKGMNLSSFSGTATNLACGNIYGLVPSFQNTVTVIGKPTNTALPLLLPVKDVTVETNVAILIGRKFITNNYGIASVGCFSTIDPYGYSIRVRHAAMNFDGKGFGQWSNWVYRAVYENRKPIIVQGDINLPCGTGSLPNPIPSNFSLGSIPKITIPTITFNIPNYGFVSPGDVAGGMVVSLFINGTKVYETNKTTSSSVVWEFPANLLSILTKATPFPVSLTPGSSISVYAVASFGSCQLRSNTINITLPTPQTVCQAFSQRLNQSVGMIKMPKALLPPGAGSLPFEIFGLEEFCTSLPTDTKFIKAFSGNGTLRIGNLPPINIPITQGRASVDLSQLIDLSSLFGGL